MTVLEFIGCACIAYGPTLAIIAFIILRDPVRSIVFVASAFFWLVSFILSSFVWFFVPVESLLIIGVIVSVLLQEVFRYLLFYVIKKAEKILKQISQVDVGHSENNRKVLSFVGGLGFGVMSGTYSFVNVLSSISGPTTIGLKGGYPYFTLVSALLTLCFTLLNTFWSVIFFSAIERKNFFLLGWVVFSHLLASCITLLNEKSLYLVCLGFTYSILVITGHLAYKTHESRVCLCVGFCKGRHTVVSGRTSSQIIS